jgi:membrane associated rhomboid family serine protease
VRRPAFQQIDRSQFRITPVALYLLFALVAVSLVFAMSGKPAQARMAEWMVPYPDGVWGEGKVWTLVTGPLLEVNLLPLVFSGLMIWLLLPSLERWWGPRRFALFVGVTALAGTIGGTLIGQVTGEQVPILGLDPTLFAGAVAFGIIHARAPVQFFGVLPLTGRQFMWGMIAVMAAFVLIGQEWEEGGAMVAATSIGAALASGVVDPIAWWRRRRYAKTRSHLRVVPPPPVAPPPTVRRGKSDDRYLN